MGLTGLFSDVSAIRKNQEKLIEGMAVQTQEIQAQTQAIQTQIQALSDIKDILIKIGKDIEGTEVVGIQVTPGDVKTH